MVTNKDKLTSVTSIYIIILRELRTERNLHQAQVAEWLGRTQSSWTKIETGKSPLSFETFIRVCYSFQVMPSAVLATAERYMNLFTQDGWVILTSDLESNQDDLLLSFAQEYWSTPDSRNIQLNSWGFMSVLNGPIYNNDGTVKIAPVFQFALDPVYRNTLLGS